jgi:hypothetical protein
MDGRDMYGFKEEENWALLIGRLILAGGHCESHVNYLLKVWSSPAVFHAVAKLEYMDRLKLAKALTHEWADSLGASNAEALEATLDRMAKLVPTRNLIAHNQFGIRSSEGREPHGVIQRLESTSKGRAFSWKITTIELSELEAKVLRMEEVAKLISGSLPGLLHQAKLRSKYGRIEPLISPLEAPQLLWDPQWR